MSLWAYAITKKKQFLYAVGCAMFSCTLIKLWASLNAYCGQMCLSIIFISAGGQAERSDQGCRSHRGALLAKSVCQGDILLLVEALLTHLPQLSTTWLPTVNIIAPTNSRCVSSGPQQRWHRQPDLQRRSGRRCSSWRCCCRCPSCWWWCPR